VEIESEKIRRNKKPCFISGKEKAELNFESGNCI
jgi:hypothetical protein